MTSSTIPTLDMAAFGQRLRAARLRADVTQTDLAKACEINLPNLNALERGKAAGARAETVFRLAWRLGVSSDYLLGLTDDPTPPPSRAPAKARLTPGLWKGQVWMAPDFDDTDEELIRLFEGEDDDAAS